MNTKMTAKTRGNFTVVQALRGIAAMWVVLFHASEGHHIDALRAALPRVFDIVLFDSGHYGVPIFFALSGFVIAHSLRDVALSGGTLGRFVLRRALRLDPPYWISIIVVVSFALLSARAQGKPFQPPSPGDVLAHIFYLQIVLGLPEIDTVYWTLTFEVQFYLFFAIMLSLADALSTRMPRARSVAWIGMFALACASALGFTEGAPPGLFVGLWPSFFIGVVAYHAPTDRRVFGALLLLAIFMLWSPAGQGGFPRFAVATALFLAGALATGRIRTALDWRWLQGLGTISYSLYLLHNPISGATAFVLRKLLGSGAAAQAAALVAMVLASVAGAWLYWRIVERTAHAVSRRVTLSRPAPAG